MRILALIPARYASTRFPAKPLALLAGKPIVQHVYERVKAIFPHVYVATDDQRIAQCVAGFGGQYVMTGTHHKSGTDRCYEALQHLGEENYDVVINIQGDEPFIHPTQLTAVAEAFQQPDTQIATLVKPFAPEADWETLANPNSPKVAVSPDGRALYFSRSVIPHLRGHEQSQWPALHTYYKHIGLYAYRTEVLQAITKLPQNPLEKAESLEQLRWLEAGFCIRVRQTDTETIGIDTPADLQAAEAYITQHKSENQQM